MKIVKFSARMFDTYGMEDLLFKSFERHYRNFLKGDFPFLQNARWQLGLGKLVRVGSMRIGPLLDHLVEKHGPPLKKNYPRTVTFAMVSPKSPYVKKQTITAFFSQGPFTGNLYIVIVTDSIDNLETDDTSLKSTFHHELQHLVKNMYDTSVFPSTEKEKEVGSLSYYSRQTEIQAFCAGIARKAVADWIFVAESAMKKWSPEKILLKISEWREPETFQNLFNLFVMNSFAGAFKYFDEARDKKISTNSELKKQYLYYTFRNVELILNRYLDNLEQKVVNTLNYENTGTSKNY